MIDPFNTMSCMLIVSNYITTLQHIYLIAKTNDSTFDVTNIFILLFSKLQASNFFWLLFNFIYNYKIIYCLHYAIRLLLITQSAEIIVLTTLTAFFKAVFVTNTGSIIPALIILTSLPVLTSIPLFFI